jgi:hypothetical protein
MKITPKHGKSAPRRAAAGAGMRNSLELKCEDHTWRSRALVHWPRGFLAADAPPNRNEWTRALACGRMGPR